MALAAKQVLQELLASCLALAARQVQLGLQAVQWFMMQAVAIAELVTHFLFYPRPGNFDMLAGWLSCCALPQARPSLGVSDGTSSSAFVYSEKWKIE